jgi:hypothetical protein
MPARRLRKARRTARIDGQRVWTRPDGVSSDPDGLTWRPDAFITRPDGLTQHPDGLTEDPGAVDGRSGGPQRPTDSERLLGGRDASPAREAYP